jgi:hypothetical protein
VKGTLDSVNCWSLLLTSTATTAATSAGDRHHTCDVLTHRASTTSVPKAQRNWCELTKSVPVTVTFVPIRCNLE